MAVADPGAPAAAEPDAAARHPTGGIARPKAAGARSLRARSRAPGAGARELRETVDAARMAADRWRARPRCGHAGRRTGCGVETRAAVSARTSRAPAARSTVAQASSVAP